MTPFVRLWILISVFASFTGWTLSALGQLNRIGYAASFVLFMAFLWWQWQPLGLVPGKINLRRFRRPLPFCFAALAGLILLGGLFYPPSNYTGLTYHIPRVLHWLAAGRWHWIHTSDNRMNFSGCDFEWLFAPLLLFTKSDRALFLLNFLPFLLLPGLVFSVFTRLGLRPRMAWPWMWLLPTGYTFLLQAGSIANDAGSAVFALAAIDFGCRAWQSRQPRDLWYSLLAVALLVGTKPTSLPLLLPWTLLIFALLPLVRRKLGTTLLVSAVALTISFFPIALMNKIHSGGWLGASLDDPRLHVDNPLMGIGGNSFEMLVDNFTPPLFPLANWYNQHVLTSLPRSWIASFQDGFFHIWELPTEDWSGVGFGISGLALISALAALFLGRNFKPDMPSELPVPRLLRHLLLVTPWVGLLAYCAKSGLATPSRLVASYYPLLLPLLLAGAGQSQIVRRVWWRGLAGVVMFLAFVVLIVSPDRPLWPAKQVLARLAGEHPDRHLYARALEVYTVYSHRNDPLAQVRALLPPEVTTVGFIGAPDDSDISFWRPFDGRRVEHFLLGDPAEKFRAAKIEYVVVGGLNLQLSGMTLDEWLQKTGARLVATATAKLKVSEGPQPWFIVQFKP